MIRYFASAEGAPSIALSMSPYIAAYMVLPLFVGGGGLLSRRGVLLVSCLPTVGDDPSVSMIIV